MLHDYRPTFNLAASECSVRGREEAYNWCTNVQGGPKISP